MLAFKKIDLDSSNLTSRNIDVDVVLKVQGCDELSVLCPVSKLTGFPMSMQQAIFMISDQNSRLADVLFEEIPTLVTSDRISDDDKLRLLVSRLDSGSFFENDKVVEQLGNIAKEFFPEAKEDVTNLVESVVNKPSDVVNVSPE